jgi:hypothetical protein
MKHGMLPIAAGDIPSQDPTVVLQRDSPVTLLSAGKAKGKC